MLRPRVLTPTPMGSPTRVPLGLHGYVLGRGKGHQLSVPSEMKFPGTQKKADARMIEPPAACSSSRHIFALTVPFPCFTLLLLESHSLHEFLRHMSLSWPLLSG